MSRRARRDAVPPPAPAPAAPQPPPGRVEQVLIVRIAAGWVVHVVRIGDRGAGDAIGATGSLWEAAQLAATIDPDRA